MTRPARPTALNLARLARSTPGAWVELSGGLGVLQISGDQSDEALACTYIVLAGHLLIDLPYRNFAELRVGEAYRVGAGVERVLNPLDEVTVLRLREG